MSAPALTLILARALPVSAAVLLVRLLILSYLILKPACRSEIRNNHRIVCGRDQPGFWMLNAWRLGRNLVLMARIDLRPGRLLVDKAEVGGDNRSVQSMEQNMQAVMASFHFGLWEFLPAVFRQRGHRVALAVGVQRNRALDRMLRPLRSGAGVRLLHSAVELAGHGLTGLVGFMLDNTGRGRMTVARSNRVAMRMPGPAFRLGGRAGVIPVFCGLERGRLRVRAYPPGDQHHALECLLAEVRRSPADWVFWGKNGALSLVAGSEGRDDR